MNVSRQRKAAFWIPPRLKALQQTAQESLLWLPEHDMADFLRSWKKIKNKATKSQQMSILTMTISFTWRCRSRIDFPSNAGDTTKTLKWLSASFRALCLCDSSSMTNSVGASFSVRSVSIVLETLIILNTSDGRIKQFPLTQTSADCWTWQWHSNL